MTIKTMYTIFKEKLMRKLLLNEEKKKLAQIFNMILFTHLFVRF